MKNDIWIAGITRGHNASVCLLKNGKIVFSIEEERLTRKKYDGTPTTAMQRILDYTDKLDYLAIAHTTTDVSTVIADFTGTDIYTATAIKMKLLPDYSGPGTHPRVVNLGRIHHKLHAAAAFYRSGFEEAVAVIVDGAGSVMELPVYKDTTARGWETESIYKCNYPNKIKTLYKHMGTISPVIPGKTIQSSEQFFEEPGETFESVVSNHAGIVKTYEAVTEFCGFHFIEAGKTMGLFPYGEENDKIPTLFDSTDFNLSDRNFIIPTYPNGAYIAHTAYSFFNNHKFEEGEDLTHLKNRRDLAYAVQTQSQKRVAELIKKAIEMSGCKNVVISGGYGLNCVANYYYLKELEDEGINLYVEPVSNDAGTAMGAAILVWKDIKTENNIGDDIDYSKDGLYLGFEYTYSDDDINQVAEKYNAEVKTANNEDIIDLITSRNIVSLFQGKSEAGPRALGNRSILYDPTDPNGKDHVNRIKRREYFRPFAGSILHDDVHDWFDLRGMDETPYMMYAVNCKTGIKEKIPAIIHVDDTCRIQTVKEEQNPHYYSLIKEFKNRTGVPIIFNTSFNLGGEPLVETLDDAVRTLANSEIEYLYLPEYKKLIILKN